MAVKIIVDSTVDVRADIKDQFLTVPLTVSFGGEEYIDGVTIDHKKFYEKLVESDVLPTTSQASPAAFEDIFSRLAQDGDQAVVLTLSSALSGTYQSACIAAADYPDTVYVVDTQSVSIGAGILAEYALQLVQAGMGAEAIARQLTEMRQRVCVVAMLDTLEYLKKGGRISSAAALAGGLLSIKPVISLSEGKIVILGKARGSKQGNNLLVQQIEKAGGVDFEKPLLLGYTGLSDLLLKKYVEDSKHLWQKAAGGLQYAPVGSVIGTHAGPGAIAVAFFKKQQ